MTPRGSLDNTEAAFHAMLDEVRQLISEQDERTLPASAEELASATARLEEWQQLLVETMWDLRHPRPHNARMADRIEQALRAAGVEFKVTGPMFGGRQTRRHLIDIT